MNTLKELYGKLLDNYNGNYICTKIKSMCEAGEFTVEEASELLTHFKTQFPTPKLHSEFYNNPLFNKTSKADKVGWFQLLGDSIRGKNVRLSFLLKIYSTL